MGLASYFTTVRRFFYSLFLPKFSLASELANDGYAIESEKDCIRLDVSHLERGLYFLSIKHESDYPLTGPRVLVARPHFETSDHIYTFVRRDQGEFFGTVLIVNEIEAINFYPSKLPCKVRITGCSVRRINSFARDYIYGETFVRWKIFGPAWTWERSKQELHDWFSRLLKGGKDDSYATWWRLYGKPSEADLLGQQQLASGWTEASVSGEMLPRFSIVMPVYKTPLNYLREAIDSVRQQTYPHWQLCICDDGSASPALTDLLAEFAASDRRIRYTSHDNNQHISAASNSALAMAEGDYVAFLDHDDSITPNALFEMATAIRANPQLQLLYSDEDVVDPQGDPVNPHFKPDWNYDLERAINYACHFLVVRRGLIEQCGGLRVGFEGAQDFDLVLRVTEKLQREQIGHIKKVLYHWRAAEGSTALDSAEKPYAADAGVKALAEHLVRSNIPGVASKAEIPTTYRVQYDLPEPPPRVSIIIPTHNNLRVLRNCVDKLLEHTIYTNYEVIIIDNRSDDPATLAYLEMVESPAVRVLKFAEPFNFSAINNFGVEHSHADIVVLLNNDTEVCNGDWLNELVSQASRPEVGAVGAKLFYAEDRIQHAGVLLGMGPDRVAAHAFKGFHRDEVGSLARTRLVQEYHAVTGACLAVSRAKYLEVGGLDADNLAIAFNDVDFCLKLVNAGYLNIWTPYAQLYHYESYSRGYDVTDEKRARFEQERDYMHQRWEGRLGIDAYYNPNLTRDFDNFSLAWPPAGYGSAGSAT